MKSIIAKYRYQGKHLIIQTSDLSKFFDKEMIEDAVMTCYNCGADPKACRLWYKINEGTRIRVRTRAGMIQFTEVGAVVGQGTLGGALVNQAVLDQGISEQFAPGGENELTYGSVPLSPLIFQDDLINGAEGIKESRSACVKMDRVVKRLSLSLNKDKSLCIALGSPKQRQNIKTELQKNPLFCGEVEIKLKISFKWLGQILSSGGLAESVHATIEAEEGQIQAACLEIAHIVKDWRSQVAGGMETGLLLWEACCVPSLLNGAGTWMEIKKTTVKKLNQIQFWGLCLSLQVGPGTPLASLLWDTAILNMDIRVKIEKFLLVLHIRSLDEETIVKKIYLEQISDNCPGLASETNYICEEFNIEDCNFT